MKPAKVGFVTCVHPFYDLPAVMKHREAAIKALVERGCQVAQAPAPRDSLDAVEIASWLKKQDVDAVLLFFCTWVAEEITLTLVRETLDLPLLLWSLPYLDRDIPMPSPMSGLTTSGSNIRRLGKNFVYVIGQPAPARLERILKALRSAAIARSLRRARFGLIGYPCPGMLDVGIDESELQKNLGAVTVHLDLDVLLRTAQVADPEQALSAAAMLSARAGGMDLSREILAENLRFYVALKQLVAQHKLDAYCVRCWPELRDQHKLTPCAAHALMAEEGIPNSCEVDLTALVTTWVLSKLSGSPAFNFDLTGYLEQEGAVQLAHCGAAAPSLAGRSDLVQLRRHMRTGTGATVEFPFPEGTVTLAKLLRPLHGRMKLFAARGRVIPAGAGVRGNVAAVIPEPSAEVFIDNMLRIPVEHHLALAYGDWTDELATFCEFTGLEYLRPVS